MQPALGSVKRVRYSVDRSNLGTLVRTLVLGQIDAKRGLGVLDPHSRRGLRPRVHPNFEIWHPCSLELTATATQLYLIGLGN
jgi:hypothetical protein